MALNHINHSGTRFQVVLVSRVCISRPFCFSNASNEFFSLIFKIVQLLLFFFILIITFLLCTCNFFENYTLFFMLLATLQTGGNGQGT